MQSYVVIPQASRRTYFASRFAIVLVLSVARSSAQRLVASPFPRTRFTQGSSCGRGRRDGRLQAQLRRRLGAGDKPRPDWWPPCRRTRRWSRLRGSSVRQDHTGARFGLGQKRIHNYERRHSAGSIELPSTKYSKYPTSSGRSRSPWMMTVGPAGFC
jgi:hypothetical protein